MKKVAQDREDAWRKKVKVSHANLVLFLRQLSILLASGVPLHMSIDTLSNQPEDPQFGRAIEEIGVKIAQGYTLSGVFAWFPRLFSPIHVALITTGERTGNLADSLGKLADWGDREGQLIGKVRAAFTYPIIVFVVACLLTIILFLTVIPGFVEMFEEKGMELPLLTRIVVWITHAVTNPGFWLAFIGVALLLVFSIRDFYRRPHGARMIHGTLHTIPLVGDILILSGTARYAAVLGTLLDSGMDLLVSLQLAGRASGDPIMEYDSERLVARIRDGESMTAAMNEKPDIYLSTVRQMLTAGEESSNLSSMCARLAAFYEDEVAYRVEALGAALEPLMLVFVSVLVGSIVLAIILPLYGFLNQLGL
ncbi:MAG: type II secretion system F family protein [Vulcanimicrobiota bacterium]